MTNYEKYLMIAEALEQEADDMQSYSDLGLPFYYKPKEIQAVRDAAERFRERYLLSKPKDNSKPNYAIAE